MWVNKVITTVTVPFWFTPFHAQQRLCQQVKSRLSSLLFINVRKHYNQNAFHPEIITENMTLLERHYYNMYILMYCCGLICKFYIQPRKSNTMSQKRVPTDSTIKSGWSQTTLLITSTRISSSTYLNILNLPGGALPYSAYTGMCRWTRYGFQGLES